MILDERTEFADATALSTAGTGRAVVGDVVPLSVARNVGSPPRPLYLVIQVVAAATGTSASTVFELVSDAQYPPLTDGTATVHVVTKAFTVAQLAAGAVVAVIPLPGEPPNYEAFLAVLQNVTTTALTGGTVNAFLTHDPKQWKAYADAI